VVAPRATMSVFFGPPPDPATPIQVDGDDKNMNVYKNRYDIEYANTEAYLRVMKDPMYVDLNDKSEIARLVWLSALREHKMNVVTYRIAKENGALTSEQVQGLEALHEGFTRLRKSIKTCVESHMSMTWNDIDIPMRFRVDES